MSIRTSGLARRSFIIGSRLCPPAMTRASGPWRRSAAIAPSTLVARSYSNGPGVCTSGPLLVAVAVAVRRAGRRGRRLGHGRRAGQRRADLAALREVAEAHGGRARVEALDEADRVLHPCLLHQQPLEQVDARVEV